MSGGAPCHLLLSAGGTSVELHERLQATHPTIHCEFLDDDPSIAGTFGTLQSLASFVEAGHKFFATFGSPRYMALRRQLLDQIPVGQLVSHIDPLSTVYESATIGSGTLVFPQAVVSSRASTGRAVLAYHGAILAHDAVIGDYSIVSNHSVVSGHCQVAEDVYIGANATVIEGVSIGARAIVAAGSTVIANVPPDTTYIAPGRIKPNRP